VSVDTPSSKTGSHLLMSKEYAVTFAPNQGTSEQSSTPLCPQSLLGS
jgi:hypothetical protein